MITDYSNLVYLHTGRSSMLQQIVYSQLPADYSFKGLDQIIPSEIPRSSERLCVNNQATLVKCTSCIICCQLWLHIRFHNWRLWFIHGPLIQWLNQASFCIIKPEKGEIKLPKSATVTYIIYDVVLNPLCFVIQIQDKIRRVLNQNADTLQIKRDVKQMRMSYQLLQGCQFLWEVTQARSVQLQPSQTAHGLNMLWEVPTLQKEKRLRKNIGVRKNKKRN